jgi:hypothetical protein
MNGSVLNPRKLALLYYFGDLDYWKIPGIAADALVGGFDGVALRKLAGLTNVVASDLISADIDAAFKEMGVEAPISKDDASPFPGSRGPDLQEKAHQGRSPNPRMVIGYRRRCCSRR